MRCVLQRVSSARVEISGETVGSIEQGLMILLGIEAVDSADDIAWLIPKIAKMRIFEDEEGKMNRSLLDVNGGALLVSQFTLQASTKKGNRPSFIKAARPEQSEPLYEQFKSALSQEIGKPVASGRFGAEMDVTLTNNGPVTILIDSQNRG